MLCSAVLSQYESPRSQCEISKAEADSFDDALDPADAALPALPMDECLSKELCRFELLVELQFESRNELFECNLDR